MIGDHAGALVPRALGSLGLPSEAFGRHIALDIGIRALGEALSGTLDATFVAQSYSRLVIDCNRAPGSPEAIPPESDGTVIPGNLGLTREARASRIAAIHEPYHAAISDLLRRRDEDARQTILIALHSFTPVMAGVERPWHVGVLHDGRNDAFARAVVAELAADTALIVGDNEPYRMDETDHTIPRHAFATGRPYLELEIRQDLLQRAEDIAFWSQRLSAIFREARSPR